MLGKVSQKNASSLETPQCYFIFLPIKQEMLPFKAINRHQNKELLCHWIPVNLKNGR